jgi:hypothetical protein
MAKLTLLGLTTRCLEWLPVSLTLACRTCLAARLHGRRRLEAGCRGQPWGPACLARKEYAHPKLCESSG